MGRLSNEEKAKREQEKEEKPVVKAEPKDKLLLQEISQLEEKVKEKRKEYSEYIASQRKEVKIPTLAECHALSMRDDKNSDRRELKKVTAMAMSKLKKSR
jgi:hypothetical protein